MDREASFQIKNPAQLFQEIAVTKEQVDQVCQDSWEQNLRTRKWLCDRWSFSQCVTDNPEAWRRYTLLLLDKIEGSSRDSILGEIPRKFMLPRQIGFDLPDEQRVFTDGVRSLDGKWVGWSSDSVADFQVLVGGVVFRVEPVFVPAWKGNDDLHDFTGIREILYPKNRVVSEFKLTASFESTSRRELESHRDRVLGEIMTILWSPLMEAGAKCVWPTSSGGLVIAEWSMPEGDGDVEFYMGISLRRRLMRSRSESFYNDLMEEMIRKKSEANLLVSGTSKNPGEV